MLPYFLAFAGGALTLLSPCILPVLPFVFARNGQPFLRGRLPLLMGMVITFTAVASLGAVAGAWAVQAHQLGRIAAIVVLGVFALSLLMPRLASWLTRPLVGMGARLIPASAGGSWVGAAILGAATGLIWAPCAGPILGLILAGAALAGPSVQTSLLLLAYATGAAVALALLLGVARGSLTALRAHMNVNGWVRRAWGGAMLASVLAISTGLDTGMLARISADITAGVEQGLLRVSMGRSTGSSSMAADVRPVSADASDLVANATGPVPSGLPIDDTRPALDGAVNWLNSPPLSVAALRGKVVLVNFWTYSCINCLRTLPHVRAWAQKYADQGLVVIGVHTPEFAFEKDAGNVARALRDLKIDYPVAQDNNYGIWRAFGNQYWPALYFIDAQGRVRHHQFGEGGLARSEQVIRALLREAGRQPLSSMATVLPDTQGVGMAADLRNVRSHETYLGYRQASGFASPEGLLPDRSRRYSTGALRSGGWGLQGAWNIQSEFAELAEPGGSVTLRFHARDAHLVLGTAPGQGPVRMQLSIDGKPPGADHGADVNAEGWGVIDAQRLYQLVRQRGPIDDRTVEIRFLDPGARAFAFTFG